MHTQDELYISTSVSHYHKYKGLLKRSIIKNYRDECFRFFDYLYTTASDHERITSIMRTLHYTQVFLIALCPLNKTFWPKESVLGKIINIAAIVVNLCTPHSSELAHITIALTLYSFLFLFFIFIIANIIIFHRYTKVHLYIINFICIFLNSLLPYFVLCIGSNIGREISVITRYYLKKMEYEPESDKEILLQLTCFSIGIFLEIILFIIQLLFVTPVLTFRPQSIHFLSSKYMFCYLGSYFLMSVILSCAGGLNNYIILFCTIIPIIFLHFLTYSHIEAWGTFEFRELSLCVLETILILLFVEYFLLIFRYQINEILLLSTILFFSFFYYMCSTQGIKARLKFLALCNRIISEPQIFDQLNESNVIMLLRIGFEMGHKLCHNWSIFDQAEMKFPNNRYLLLLLVRYSILYPEDHLILRVIITKIQRYKKHNIEYKFILFQLYSLCQQRERGLSKSLKKMLAIIDNKTDKCRSQIKTIWTSVIQGDISSIENLSFELKKSADEITREYNQLCISFPNNPYVASAFSAFLSDIWCKEKESMTFKKIYRHLRNGGKTRIEKSFYFARLLFPSLPTEDRHVKMSRDEEDENQLFKSQAKSNTNNSIISMSIDNFYEINEEITDERAQQKYLETIIESIRFSSLRYGPFLMFFIISLFFPLISILFSVLAAERMDATLNGTKFIEKGSLQRAVISEIPLTFYFYVLNSNRLVTSFRDILSLKVTSLSHLLSLANYNADLMNGMNLIFPSLLRTGYFDKTLNFLFNNSIYANRVFSNYSYGVIPHSYEFYIAVIGESVLRAVPMKAIKLLNMTDFWTLVIGCSDFLRDFDKFTKVLMDDMNRMIDGNYWNCFNLVLGLGFLSLIAFIIVAIFLFKKMTTEKEAIFTSFKSLPKSAISATITKINAQLGKHEEDQTFLSIQDETALRAFSMERKKSITKSADGFIISCLCVFVVCVVANFTFIILSQKIVIDKLPQLCEVMLASAAVHSAFAEIILTQARIVTYGQKQIPFNSLQSKSELINMTYSLFEKLQKSMHNFRFGDGYNGFNSHGLFGYDTAFFTDIFNQTANCTTEKDDRKFIQCISLENSISYVSFVLNGLFTKITKSPELIVSLNQRELEVSIRWLFNTSFPEIVNRICSSSVKKATSLHFITKTYFLILPLIFLNIIVLLCGIGIVPRLVRGSESAKWAMRLLLFCPPAVVLHSRPIIKIMTNDFSIGDDNDLDKGEFYEKVVSRMKDASIFIDSHLIVRSMNYEFLRLFGDKIGTSLFDLFDSPSDDDSSVRSFAQKLRKIGKMEIQPSFEGEITVMANEIDELDGSEKVVPKVFHFILIGVDTTGQIMREPVIPDSISFYALILCDWTSTIEAEANLAEEKAKSMEILGQVLPARILPDVSKGASKISYGVECCSFVVIDFIDVRRLMVNISPSSLLMSLKSATQCIEESLNPIDGFVRLPSFVDSIVVAFGIFDFDGDPIFSHQRRAFLFAIDSISKINGFNCSEEGQILGGLQLSVGLACGGPVVAGLLNLSVPTFSVFGWPLKLATRLSKYSPPMHAQLPRDMYYDAFEEEEEEYDESNLVIEEADFEFDGQLYDTYIVCKNEELD